MNKTIATMAAMGLSFALMGLVWMGYLTERVHELEKTQDRYTVKFERVGEVWMAFKFDKWTGKSDVTAVVDK